MIHRGERESREDISGLKSLVEGALKDLACVAEGRMPEGQDLVNFVQAVKSYSLGETQSLPREFGGYESYCCLRAFLEQKPLDMIIDAYTGVLNPNADPDEKRKGIVLAEQILREFMGYSKEYVKKFA